MGQCCIAGSRTFVHEDIYDEFVKKATARAQKRVVGDPYDMTSDSGPQVRCSADCDYAYYSVIPSTRCLIGKIQININVPAKSIDIRYSIFITR